MTPDPGTRDLILDAFARQLATVGYAGISLAGVAATAGIQKASMYHHFSGGKEQMYTEVALRYSDQLGARVSAAVSAPDQPKYAAERTSVPAAPGGRI